MDYNGLVDMLQKMRPYIVPENPAMFGLNMLPMGRAAPPRTGAPPPQAFQPNRFAEPPPAANDAAYAETRFFPVEPKWWDRPKPNPLTTDLDDLYGTTAPKKSPFTVIDGGKGK